MIKKRILVALFVIFPLVVSLACRFSAADPTATPTEEAIMPTEEVIIAPTEAPTEEQVTEETAPAITSEIQELVMLEKSFWTQRDTTVFVSFFFENPNSHVIFENVEYTVLLYNANGDEIDSDTTIVRWVFPNQTLGIVFNFYLSDETVTIDSVSVDWDYDSTTAADGSGNPFTVDNAVYWQNGDYPMVTGIINNSNPDTYSDIRANIICYNSAGEIVGSGYTYLDFIPGADYMGFATYVDTFDTVASVDVFPTFGYSTLVYEGTDFWSDISLLDDYFYTDEYGSLLGGVVIQSNVNTVLRDSFVYVTFYDDAGNVTSSGTEYVDLLLPGAELGMTPWVLTPPDGAVTSNYDVLILPGEYKNDYELMENPFTVNSSSIVGEYEDNVAVSFTNNYSKQVSEVDVSVLLYDAEGNIIGGGSDWTTEPTPAGGTTEIEVWVYYDDAKTVATIGVWITPNYWTVYE